jgi:photosystem II PsbZ protein
MLLYVFQFLVVVFIVMSVGMLIGVPVGYASNAEWPRAKQIITVGSAAWVVMLCVIGVLNFFVV